MLKQVKRISFIATDEESGASYELVAEVEQDADGAAPGESAETGAICSIQTASGQAVRGIAKGRYQIDGVFGPIELSSDDPNAP
jgi:hypothetical protein